MRVFRKRKMKTKNKIIATSLGVGTLALIGGTLAFFSSSSESVISAIGGTVGVDVSDITIGNLGNINPGDNDPTLPDGDRPEGNSHDIEFSVENTGSKSIRTKHEITITMENETLDPSVFMICDADGNEVVKKYYLVGDEYLTQNEYDKLPEGENFCSAVKYVIASDIFDGVGDESNGAEKEDVSTVHEENGVAKKEYTYQLAMSNKATDIYQGEKMNVRVETFAIQFRNTDASNWYRVSDEEFVGNTN